MEGVPVEFKEQRRYARQVRQCRFRIMNAGTSSYPAAWPGTWAVAAFGDRTAWFR